MLSKNFVLFCIAITLLLGIAYGQTEQQPTCIGWFTDREHAIVARENDARMSWRCDVKDMILPTIGDGDKTGIPKDTPIILEFPSTFDAAMNADKVKCRYSVNKPNLGKTTGDGFHSTELLTEPGQGAVVIMTHNENIELKPDDVLRLWCEGISTPTTPGDQPMTSMLIGAESEIADGTVSWPAVYGSKDELPQHLTIISVVGQLPASMARTIDYGHDQPGGIRRDRPDHRGAHSDGTRVSDSTLHNRDAGPHPTSEDDVNRTDEGRPKIDTSKIDNIKSAIQGLLGSGVYLHHYQSAYDPQSNTLTSMWYIRDDQQKFDPDLVDDHIRSEDTQRLIHENLQTIYPDLTNVEVDAFDVTLPNCDHSATPAPAAARSRTSTAHNNQPRSESDIDQDDLQGNGSTTGTKYCAIDIAGCPPCLNGSACADDSQCEHARCENGKCIHINSVSTMSLGGVLVFTILAALAIFF